MAIKQIEKITLTKHLAVMIKAGISLSEALGSLLNQAKSSEVKKVLNQIKNKVDNGSSFANALSFHSNNFDQLYIGIVKVGESNRTPRRQFDIFIRSNGEKLCTPKKNKRSINVSNFNISCHDFLNYIHLSFYSS